MASFSLSHSSPAGEQQTSSNFKKFLIVKLAEGSFNHVSPFLIHKSIQSIVGDVSSVRKIKSGDLMIEVSKKQQAETLLKCTSFGTLAISVFPHSRLNISRGVISEPDLLYVSEAEILDGLKEHNVTNVRRITIRRDVKVLPTKHLILTFDSPSIPSRIKAGYLSCSVRPFIPNPLRCFKCQRFGHSKEACRGAVTCARCALSGHESDSCVAPYKCINCAGDHPSYSRLCSKWIIEKEIQSIKTIQKLPYLEARKLVESRTPTVGVSYASVTSSKITKSVGTQTKSVGIQTDLEDQVVMQTDETSSIQIPALSKCLVVPQSKIPVPILQKSQPPKPCLPSTSKIPSSLNSKSNLPKAKTQMPKNLQSQGSTKSKKSAATLAKSSEKVQDKTSPEEYVVSMSPKPPNPKASMNTHSSKSKKTVPRFSDKPPQKLPKYMQNRFEVLQDNYDVDDFDELNCDDDSKMEASDTPPSDSIDQLKYKNESLRSPSTSINDVSKPRISNQSESKKKVTSSLNKEDRRTLYHMQLAYKFKNNDVCLGKSKEDETLALYTSDIEE